MVSSGAKGCESRCTKLLAGRRSLWDWLAGGDFSDTILGLDTIPGLGVEGSLLSDIIRLFLGAGAATVGFVCEVAVASWGLGQVGAGDEGTKAAVAGTGGLASEAIELELLIFLDESKAEVVAGGRSPSQSICKFLGS